MNKRKLDFVDLRQDPISKSSFNDSVKRLRTSNAARNGPHIDPLDSLENLDLSDSDVESTSAEATPERTYRPLSHVAVCGPAFPRSQYEGYKPPLPVSTEEEALVELQAAQKKQLRPESAAESLDYTTFILNDFTVYRGEHKTHSYQLYSLDRLKNRGGFDDFLFDGILSVGTEQHYVTGVRFEILALDGYGDPDVTDLSDCICIQSHAGKRRNIWYQLRRSSKEYRRFFAPFMWLAQFTEHFVDYLLENQGVALNDFHRDFYGWLFERYSMRGSFTTWLAACKLRDFRTTVAAHVGFLWKECHSIEDDETGLLKHPLWGEVDPFKLGAIPRQPQRERYTIVTPFAYKCFKHMYFANHLEARSFSNRRTRATVGQRKHDLGLTPVWASRPQTTGLLTPKSIAGETHSDTLHVDQGDVVCVRPNGKGWKSASTVWYAYVQGARPVLDTVKLDVIWLYEPCDTTLGTAYYPFPNELFFSDNCDCGLQAIDISTVTGKVEVDFFEQDPVSANGLFVRQKFRTSYDNDTYDFVTLNERDFKCDCKNHTPIFEECRAKFQIGDTVLYREYNNDAGEDRLEPGQIIDFLLDKQRVVLKQLARAKKYDAHAKPNQLIVIEEMMEKAASKIIRHCEVRCFHPDVLREGLPVPYNQNGSGDFYFVLSPSGSSRTPTPASARQDEDISGRRLGFIDWDPDVAPERERLTGMGIFCGGGNFDRGLEDGGAVEFKYAVDFAEHALHTYRANSKQPGDIQPFLGSVDDYLARAIAGGAGESAMIARIGGVDVIAAGSPCPGFSQVNNYKLDAKALRNSSMVASVVSYVDIYSPRYCFLENVIPMTHGNGPKKDENVFAQILAAFVALGYQVQQFLMEAWSYGSSQSRARVFIVASAPGLEPLTSPPHTHSHPNLGKSFRTSKLGESSNGKAFGRRRDDYTPFDHCSPMSATIDLPDIGDSLPQICVQHPDHRMPQDQNNLARDCIAVVPTHPRGMGFVTAIREAVWIQNPQKEQGWCSQITGGPLQFYREKLAKSATRNREGSKVYARVCPDRLFPTVLTALRTNDGINGQSLHWTQPRTLTIMELRRAQGFLDDEVIIGNPNDQVRIIGNSVDRKVALALGLSLRQSWLKMS